MMKRIFLNCIYKKRVLSNKEVTASVSRSFYFAPFQSYATCVMNVQGSFLLLNELSVATLELVCIGKGKSNCHGCRK